MIQYNFLEWVKDKELNEVQFARNLSHDSFANIDQKQGDFVYFGVHDIARFYKEHQYLPPTLDIETVVQKSGRIEDADPINHMITVVTAKEPFHYGYRKLEDFKAREKRKNRPTKEIKVNIPINHLQDITYMLDPKAPFEGQRLWLVIDGNTSFQQQIMRAIRKKEHERKSAVSQAVQMPQDQEIDPNKLAAAKDWLTGKGEKADMERPTAQSIFPDEQPIKTNPGSMYVKNRLQMLRNRQQGQLDVAWVNPYDKFWRHHGDEQFYEYCYI